MFVWLQFCVNWCKGDSTSNAGRESLKYRMSLAPQEILVLALANAMENNSQEIYPQRVALMYCVIVLHNILCF